MCGILGIFDPEGSLGTSLYLGAMSLQHRGQDSAGLVTFDKRFHACLGNGLLSDVLQDRDLTVFKGDLGVAHLRYATAGAGGREGSEGHEECQPLLLSFPFGLALVHNGNLTNDARLRRELEQKSRHVNSMSDSETILQVFAEALSREDLAHPTAEGILRATRITMECLEGAYSVVILIANLGLLAFRDPAGIRPLVMGKKGKGVVFASESVALDVLGAVRERDVQPGEAVFVDKSGRLHSERLIEARPAHCIFEYVYLARPESTIDEKSVSEVREALGKSLAACFRGSADLVLDVPSSAEEIAMAFAREAKIPYRKGIRKNHYSHRSFIAANPELRRNTVGVKYLLDRRILADRKAVVIDDSIVRGTTARSLISKLRAHGVKTISFLSASPPVKHPCPYGIDMAIRQDLLAFDRSEEEIAAYLGVEQLQYQTVSNLEKALPGGTSCLACFTGHYPTKLDEETLTKLENNRLLAHKA
jgi:amidophosphoribosyltransferase